MSKKKVKVRRRWSINPKTKVKKSNKIYSRKHAKEELKKRLRSNNEA